MKRLRISLAAFPLTLLLIAPVEAADGFVRYALDAGSSVEARVGFFGLASKTAGFPKVSGSIQLAPSRLQAISLTVRIDATAITASDQATLGRLKGSDFFDVQNYPAVTYRGTAMRMTGERTADVTGEITARGVTRPSVLHVTFAQAPARLSGREAVDISGITQIDRRQFGMTAYQLVVGNTVTIQLKARMVPG